MSPLIVLTDRSRVDEGGGSSKTRSVVDRREKGRGRGRLLGCVEKENSLDVEGWEGREVSKKFVSDSQRENRQLQKKIQKFVHVACSRPFDVMNGLDCKNRESGFSKSSRGSWSPLPLTLTLAARIEATMEAIHPAPASKEVVSRFLATKWKWTARAHPLFLRFLSSKKNEKSLEAAMEAILTDCVQNSLRHFMYRNAIFICERLCAEFASEVSIPSFFFFGIFYLLFSFLTQKRVGEIAKMVKWAWLTRNSILQFSEEDKAKYFFRFFV